MSKLLSYFLVENKDSNIVFKKSISQKPTSSSIQLNPPLTRSSSSSTCSITSTKNMSKCSQKLDNKRQLKLTQLLFNKSEQSTSTNTAATNNISTTTTKNNTNITQQLKSRQIPLQTLQSQVGKQKKSAQLPHDLSSSSHISSFTFEFKDGIPRQTYSDVDNSKYSHQNQKQVVKDLPSDTSPSNYDIQTQMPHEFTSSSSLSYIFSSKPINKQQITNAKRKCETVVSEFELIFNKKRSVTEIETDVQMSPKLAAKDEVKPFSRNNKKQMSFLSQDESGEDMDESSNGEIFQNMKDLFTCTETLLSPLATDEVLEESENETQTTQKQSKNKLSLKNRLKIIDSFKKQSAEEQLEEFEESLGVAHLEKELNYQQEYLENLIQLEKDYAFDYSVYRHADNQIDSKMRCIVVNWIFELCSDYNLTRQTCQTAINIFDRFVSKKYTQISKSNIQLVAAACVQISSKKEEQFCPNLKHFITSTKNSFTAEQFRNQELDILNVKYTIDSNQLQITFIINGVCFEEWLYNICSRWDEYISEVHQQQECSSDQNAPIFFNKKSEESKQRYIQLQKIIDLMQLDEQVNQYEKHVIVLALIYVSYGIYSQDFLLEDVINYFSSISMFYQKDYFQSYNSLMQSFKDAVFIPNTRTSSNITQNTFIDAIQFVSKFYAYFKTPYSSNNKVIEQNGRQCLLENGLQFVQSLQ